MQGCTIVEGKEGELLWTKAFGSPKHFTQSAWDIPNVLSTFSVEMESSAKLLLP
jgi:hypothetical protein